MSRCMFIMVVLLVGCLGCAGAHYQAQTSANYLYSTSDVSISTTVIVQN